jgi:hypothetical protein
LAALPAVLVVSLEALDPPGTKVTWNGEIARLVRARCVRCHSPGGKGLMPLLSYEEARPYAHAIREEVLTRRIPKWHAARGYGRFANDPSLSSFEVGLFVAWVDGGAVRGVEPATQQAVLERPAEPTPAGKEHTATIACSNRRLPSGRLTAITPRLEEGAAAGFTLMFPDGRREVLAWIRDFERAFTETYRLRTPIQLRTGTRLLVEATGRCSISLTIE